MGPMITRKKRWKKLWVEGDSIVIIEAFNGRSMYSRKLGEIVDESRKVKEFFYDIHFSHIRGVGN